MPFLHTPRICTPRSSFLKALINGPENAPLKCEQGRSGTERRATFGSEGVSPETCCDSRSKALVRRRAADREERGFRETPASCLQVEQVGTAGSQGLDSDQLSEGKALRGFREEAGGSGSPGASSGPLPSSWRPEETCPFSEPIPENGHSSLSPWHAPPRQTLPASGTFAR